MSEEVNERVPLVIGMSPGSTEAAVIQAKFYAGLKPAALMLLPPSTMKLDEMYLVEHYVEIGHAVETPVMVQQSPQIQQYAPCQLSTENLARIAHRSPNVKYFKIEGPGSAKRIGALKARLSEHFNLFGGVGGIALRDELREGAAGLLPGVGFNEYFLRVWEAWKANNLLDMEAILGEAQALVEAVSASGHEYSLHARKYLLHRAGIIRNPYVRKPTIRPEPMAMEAIGRMVDGMGLRISK